MPRRCISDARRRLKGESKRRTGKVIPIEYILSAVAVLLILSIPAGKVSGRHVGREIVWSVHRTVGSVI